MTNTQLQTTNEAREAAAFYAKHALQSKAFAGIANESAAIIKIELGRELGMSAIASLQGIMFNERGGFTLSATLQGACLQRHGYSWKVVKLTDDECALDIYRGGDKIGESTLTMKQAAAAKMNQQWSSKDGAWTEKHTWKSFPRNMLFARCLTNAVKWYAPEVLAGVPMYDPDELEGLPPSEAVIDVTPTPSTNGNGKTADKPAHAPAPAPDLKPVSARNRALVSNLVDLRSAINDEAKSAKEMDDKQRAAFVERVRKLERDTNAQLVLRGMAVMSEAEKIGTALGATHKAISQLVEHDQNAPVVEDDAQATAEALAA